MTPAIPPRRVRTISATKIERFCQAIVAGRSQSDAYRMAFKPKWMKANTIHSRAYEMAARSEVRVRLVEIMTPIKAETKLTAELWQLELDRSALGDVRKLFDTHGKPLDIAALGDDEAACIAGFEIIEQFSGKGEDRVLVSITRKYRLVDKLKALELVGKTRGYYREKREPTGELTLKALVLDMMEIEQKGR
jgi:phage terminase small subunit